MATVNPTTERLPDQDAILYTWVLTNTDSVGAPITAHEFGDRTLQVTGTFDSATVVLEGANVSTYTTLTDPQGNSMSKTAAAIEQAEPTSPWQPTSAPEIDAFSLNSTPIAAAASIIEIRMWFKPRTRFFKSMPSSLSSGFVSTGNLISSGFAWQH